jgi:VWFA-related protein
LTLLKSETYTDPMKSRRRSASFGLLVAAVTASALLGAQARERSVYVSALDKTGAVVQDLGVSDIVVREDNVAREILRVAPADEPMQIALLVDTSQAAEPYIRDYREALPAFITTVTENKEPGTRNEVALITIGERPTIVTDFTFDRAQLLKGVQRVFSMSGSGTYLLDALIEISQGIMKRRAARPVIVAVTTEGPELSDRHYDQVLEPLRASGAALNVIIVGPPVNQSQDRSVVLDRGPRETGGVYDNLLTGSALTARLKQLAEDLTHQYRVTYARPQTLIPPERVTVTAARPGITVRGTAAIEPPAQGRR